MPTKKKKFIDKKNAVTFHVVHRSQKDPLLADETAPKHVLVEDIKDKEVTERRKEQQRKFGIYFDDDYDYLKHLKDVNSVPECEVVLERVRIDNEEISLQLPSSVFQSEKEEKEGLLNKIPTKGPRPDWDPDIVEALDSEFVDPEDELEDDFIVLADGIDSDEEITEGREGDDEEGFDDDDDASCGSDSFFEDTKSRLTNYSLTSSVLPRSENLEFLDEKFEKMLAKYDDIEIGSLDGEDITGYIHPNSLVLTQMADDFDKQKKTSTLQDIREELIGSDGDSTKAKNLLSGSDEYANITVEEECDKHDRWDCESILSTYSNHSNHPQLIREPAKVPIKINEKTGVPAGIFAAKQSLTKQKLRKLQRIHLSDDDSSSNETYGEKSAHPSQRTAVSAIRPKNETREERRARKTAVKLIRKERRIEKKSNKLAFKEEKKIQEKISQNNVHNLQKIKLV